MNIQDLQEIIKLMEDSDLSELSFERENFKLSLKRGAQPLAVLPKSLISMPSLDAQLELNQGQEVKACPSEDKNIHWIKAPMVGTFYSSASPENGPFVSKGDRVMESSVVCILEAMKVMNEIHAECSGEILDILVESGAPVEYGQTLFKVKLI
ncbi:MAG: acetyl-CoA carboxylase biotin carboxyl carrier protein [Puniceicoccales bacterium]|jgi:acetyl-CoA carboxylase biotin carboxyl carrier protein|nr:acetyl-CoA carboxylase biotin carboxyl carrier protein [Puniceicoccales bacterium]